MLTKFMLGLDAKLISEKCKKERTIVAERIKRKREIAEVGKGRDESEQRQ